MGQSGDQRAQSTMHSSGTSQKVRSSTGPVQSTPETPFSHTRRRLYNASVLVTRLSSDPGLDLTRLTWIDRPQVAVQEPHWDHCVHAAQDRLAQLSSSSPSAAEHAPQARQRMRRSVHFKGLRSSNRRRKCDSEPLCPHHSWLNRDPRGPIRSSAPGTPPCGRRTPLASPRRRPRTAAPAPGPPPRSSRCSRSRTPRAPATGRSPACTASPSSPSSSIAALSPGMDAPRGVARCSRPGCRGKSGPAPSARPPRTSAHRRSTHSTASTL